MTPERWQQLKTLFSGAVELEGNERARFIAEADPELASSLRNLIEHDESAAALLDGPLIAKTRIAEYLAAGVRTFQEGEVIAHRFRIEGFLGEGGMGEVYRAYDLELGESLALKTLRPALVCDEELIRRFKQETQAARRVTHHNVSRVFELFRCEVETGLTKRTAAFLTMELLPGETLFQSIQRHGAIPANEALSLVSQIVEGLAAAHAAGFLHRDLKSGNIMLVTDAASATRAVITDFGLACPVNLSGNGAGNRVEGTLAYAAPEQLAGAPATIASDIYSLGVVMFEMRTGQLPFQAATLDESIRQRTVSLRDSVKPLESQWQSVILRCLETDPAKRPTSAQEVLSRLRSKAASRRHFVAGVAAASALAGAGWYLTRPKPLNPEALKSFQRGLDFSRRRNEEGLRNAIAEFSRATAVEPKYLEAWIGTADAYSAMGNFGFMEPRAALAAAGDAAAKALAINSGSGRAAGVMGYVTSLDVGHSRRAEPYFVKAIAAEPRDPTIRLWYGAHLGKLGRSAESIRQLHIGLDLDPMSLILNQQLAAELFRARRYEEYYTQARELVRLQPFEPSSHLALARALEYQAKYEEALAECEEARKYSASMTSLCFRGSIEAAMGNLKAAEKDAETVHQYWLGHPFQTMLLAGLYARIRRPKEAVDVLNKGFDRGDSTVLSAGVNPYLDPLKDDLEFRRFLVRIGWHK